MSDVTMPQLGETVTEGTITRWAKSVGDQVAQDEVLFEVSTDKVDSEVPSPYGGYVSEILVEEGATVDVGTRLAVISDSPPVGAAAPAGQAAAAPAEEPAPDAVPAEEPPASAAPAPPAEEAPAPVAEARAPERAAPARRPAPAPPPEEGQEDGAPADGSRVLSPVVRRLVAEHGLDPATISGTGAGGRITRSDVLAAVDARGGTAPPAAPAAPPPPPPPPGPPRGREGTAASPAGAGQDDEVVPFTNIRRRTAEHMVRSKATSAHTLTASEVDFHAVDAARAQVKDAFREAEVFSLTYLPFIARAVIDALEQFPRLNASVGDDALIVHRRVHLGFAVDLDLEGLIVPVVKDADGKRLRAIAREVRELAEKARSKRLTADEIAGGTFTITNPGPFGTFMTVPIINQPQVAILSTDGVKRRPVVAELAGGGEGIVIHPVGILALSFDHRAVDGAYASAFLARCREIIETRDWIQEL